MVSLKLSSNYQIVVPKAVRQKLGLQKGQLLYVKSVGKAEVVLTSQPPVDKYYGALEGVWREGAVAYQRKVRKEYERG